MTAGGSSEPDGASRESLVVTIDGPAGTGKSSVGRELARQLGLEFLDTGAMYRAATVLVIEQSIDPHDSTAVAETVNKAGLRFDWATDPPTLLVCDQPMTDRLRQPDVAALISLLSAQAPLREVLVERQRAIADAHPCLVTEGRDQGSVVFPKAAVKIYLTASAKARAQRRAKQLANAGMPADVDRIERELIERDRADSQRPVGPLVRPADAIEVDTTEMSFAEVISTLEKLVRKLAPAGAPMGSLRGDERDG